MFEFSKKKLALSRSLSHSVRNKSVVLSEVSGRNFSGKKKHIKTFMLRCVIDYVKKSENLSFPYSSHYFKQVAIWLDVSLIMSKKSENLPFPYPSHYFKQVATHCPKKTDCSLKAIVNLETKFSLIQLLNMMFMIVLTKKCIFKSKDMILQRKKKCSCFLNFLKFSRLFCVS